MRHPFVLYADFESFMKPNDTCQPDSSKSNTKNINITSFCYYIKCFDDKVYSLKVVVYTSQSEDDDVSQKLVDMLEKKISRKFIDGSLSVLSLSLRRYDIHRK